jgi:hypothetical protein
LGFDFFRMTYPLYPHPLKERRRKERGAGAPLRHPVYLNPPWSPFTKGGKDRSKAAAPPRRPAEKIIVKMLYIFYDRK